MELIKFESVIIVNGNLDEAAANDVIVKYIHQFNEWAAPVTRLGYTPVVCDKKGKKALAYELKKQKEAWFYIITFWSESKNIEELDRLYRIDKDVLRFMTFKVEDNVNKLNIDNPDSKSEQPSPDDSTHHPLGQNHYDYLFGYTDELKT